MLACKELDSINEVSMQVENKYHDFSQKFTQYARELQILKPTFQRLKLNDKSLKFANIIGKIYKHTYWLESKWEQRWQK